MTGQDLALTTTGHAAPELLASYASGALADGMRLAVACHLTFCPECQALVARFEAVCGVLLQDGEEVAPTPACRAGALARIAREEPAAPAAPPAFGASPLPAPLRARLGLDFGQIRWRPLLPGLAEHRLKDFVGEDVRLMRVRPGVRIPRHSHEGEEATLILTGAMRDGDRTFARGDLALSNDGDEHGPEIIGPETCICLLVLGGRLRFTGPLGPLLNLIG